MPFSRSQRLDRRKRVILDSVASDSDFAVESARAAKRNRKQLRTSSNSLLSGFDSGTYSPSVRKPCQMRLVQAIPIKPTVLSAAIASLWVVWLMLVAAHYFFHSSANSIGRSSLPLLQLFDLRSPHSIANWLTCQLWMFCAIASWMLYSIRKHRLDDFTATYRVWLVMLGVSVFSSFDASTSSLYLLGQSIDPWTKKEMGYGGWPLVLAVYASVVALVGLRLTGELRAVPGAVALWFGGLIAWGCAALLGTGLLKLQWSLGSIDLFVGACWLGGVLAVFQSVGLTLRYCYMQAQYRFIERIAFTKASNTQWSKSVEDEFESQEEKQAQAEEIDGETPKKSWLPWKRKSVSSEEIESEQEGESKEEEAGPPKRPMRLFGFIPHRVERNEQPIEEPLRIDEALVVDQGLTKKPGWFQRRGASGSDVASGLESKSVPDTAVQKSTQPNSDSAEPAKKKSWFPSFGKRAVGAKDGELVAGAGDTALASKDTSSGASKPVMAKSAPIQNSSQSKPVQAAAGVSSDTKNSATVSSASASSASVSSATKSDASKSPAGKSPAGKREDSENETEGSETPKRSWLKKGWNPFRRSAETKDASNRVEAFEILGEVEAPKTKKLAGKILGLFDGLKLRPPKDSSAVSQGLDTAGGGSSGSGAKSGAAAGSVSSGTAAPKSAVPGSNMGGANSAGSVPQASQPASQQGTGSEESEDEDEEDYGNQRPLSKAERKKLRRQGRDAA
jgi:hypothetical protein